MSITFNTGKKYARIKIMKKISSLHSRESRLIEGYYSWKWEIDVYINFISKLVKSQHRWRISFNISVINIIVFLI